MFYTCSLDLAAACSPNDFLGIPQCVLLKSSPIQSACCSSDSVMVCFPSFRSPMTFGASTVDLGSGSLTAWREAFRAKTSALPERGPASAESVPDSGPSSPGSLARWNPSSSSWRTRQRSLEGGLIEYSETFPKWGSMRNGELFPQKTPSGLVDLRQWITCVKEFGSSVTTLPTAGASKANNDVSLRCSGDGREKPNKLGWAVATLPTPTQSDGAGGPGCDGREGGLNLRTAVSVGTPTTAKTGRSDRFKKGRRRTPQEIAESMTAPTPSASDASRGGVLTDNMTGVSLVQYVNTTRVPTPHGFSKDGKSNGPSGNELGHAVNRMRVPTPRSADGIYAGVTATCTTKRRAANGQANLGEFVLATIPTPAAQDAKNSRLPVSQTDRDSVPGYMIRTGQEGSLNPDWVEWLMCWPVGWTSFEPMSADTFDEWLILVQMRAWHHVEPPIPRTAKDIANRVARLKAIGNGQHSLAAWLAWTILFERLMSSRIDKPIPTPEHA